MSDIVISEALYKELEEVLSARQFKYSEDDEDNDYEVINALIDLRAAYEQSQALQLQCPECHTLSRLHKPGCIYFGSDTHYHTTMKVSPNAR